MILIFNFKDGREGLTRQSMHVSEKNRNIQNESENMSDMDILMEKRKNILKKKTLTSDDDEQVEIIEAKITDEIATREFEN